MKIRYTHSAGVTAELPAGDELARHAADAYGHTLNTPERVNRPHGARDFAHAIRDAYDMAEPRNAAIVEHLETLEPETPETPAARLEYLRTELRAERISYGELAELQDLAPHIAPDDVELLEAAGVPEETTHAPTKDDALLSCIELLSEFLNTCDNDQADTVDLCIQQARAATARATA
jgi:hypothetical protein